MDDQNHSSMTEDNVLLETMGQYTERTRAQIYKLDNLQSNILAVLLALITFLSIIISIISSMDGLRNNRVDTLLWDRLNTVPGVMILSAGLASGMLLSVITLQRMRRLRFEIQRLSSILLVIVRRISQLRERDNFTMSQRIIIDIKIAEADFILDRARIRGRGALAKAGYEHLYEIKAKNSNDPV